MDWTETLPFAGLLGLLRQPKIGSVRKIEPEDLKNLQAQKRLVEDAVRTEKMLLSALQVTLSLMQKKYDISDTGSIDMENGEITGEDNG